jgi:YVTN family beta-propeller protein
MGTNGRELAYVSNSYADTVSVIDLATNEVTDTIRMDHGEKHDVERWPEGLLQLANTPMNPTFSLDGSELYVPNPEGYNIAVVDPATNEVTRIIELSMKPNDLAFTPGGERAVVTLLGYATGKQGACTVLDVSSGKTTDPIMVGTQPEEVVLMPDGKSAYVVSKSIWVIDIEANEVAKEIHVPHWCYDAVLSPDASTLYLTATFGADKIVVIDTATNSVTGTIDVLMPACMAFTHDGEKMIVSNVYNNSLQTVDLSTNEVSDPVPVGELPSYIALNQAGDRAVVCHPAGDSVTVIDTASLATITTIPVDLGPCAVAIGAVP